MIKTYKSGIAGAMHKMVSDFHEVGVISKSTMREIDKLGLAPVKKLSPEQIKILREENCASQAVCLW